MIKIINFIENKSKFIFPILAFIFVLYSFAIQKSYLYIPPETHYGWTLIETIQVIVISIIILLTFVFKKRFQSKYSKKGLVLRVIVFLLLLYEELSWISVDFCQFCSSSLNRQGEFNFHNLTFAVKYWPIFYGIPLLVICYGNYFKIPKSLSGLSLEKKYSIFGSIFLIDRIIYWSIFALGIVDRSIYIFLIHMELIELYTYLVLLFDLIKKLKNIESKKDPKVKNNF